MVPDGADNYRRKKFQQSPKCKSTAWVSREQKLQGANTLENESSSEHKFPGQFAPRSERTRERKFQGVKWPGPTRTFAPGCELVGARKGSVPKFHCPIGIDTIDS